MEAPDVARFAQEILDTHHRFLHREMPALTAALRGAPMEVRQAWDELERILEDHLMKEEVILFPSILGLAGGDASTAMHVIGPIPQMRADHEQIRRLERVLRDGAPRAGDAGQALVVLLDDLAEHARKEDEILFPAALGLLPGTPDLEAIEAAVQAAAPPPRRPAPRRPDPPAPPPPRPGFGRRLVEKLLGR